MSQTRTIQFLPLPAVGRGFTAYNRERDGRDQWARAETLIALLGVCAASASAGLPPVSVGDISFERGGPFPGHSSHRDGRDVDFRPFRKDGSGGRVTIHDADYDRGRTRLFIQTLRERAAVRSVLFNDPALAREGMCTPWPGHDNHLHVRFGDAQPEAIKLFQREAGLEQTGAVGPRTLAKLKEVLTAGEGR